jgi:fumarylacetoacetate (FAA) hydrolase
MIIASIESSRPDLARDGELVLVHPNRQEVATLPKEAFSSLRDALDSWEERSTALSEIDHKLRNGSWSSTRPLSQVQFKAPLPRTWAFLDGSTFVQHVILTRRARGAEPPEDLLTVPLMYQGASDNLLGPHEDIPLRAASDGMDFESEVGVITGQVPLGTKACDAAKHIKLILLINDVSLRDLIPRELATGFGFFHGKPPSSFSPFALTPDELGNDWREGRLHLPVTTTLNNKQFGSPNAGEMHFSFPDLIQYACATRPLSAGTIIGSGTVSNKDESVGSSCLVEKRMLEKIHSGSITTSYLKDGDTVEISVKKDGIDLFGTIQQTVRQMKGT